MKKYISILVLYLTASCQLISQGDYENHKKYWYYKTRLNNDFVKVGTSTGESMPFNERGWGDYIPQNFIPTKDVLKLGDGSARLGIYLAALATEYRLLKNNGQDVSKIKHEIFCALNAINRIDFWGEAHLGNPSNSGFITSLNGFFIRDDVPSSIVKNNYEHFNYYNNGVNNSGNPVTQNQDKGFTQTYTQGMLNVGSTYKSFVEDYKNTQSYEDNLKGAEESQDQAYYLLMGLALTSQLVDAGETDNNASFSIIPGASGTDLRDQAKQISDRIITYIANDPFWKIRNPVNVDGANPQGKPVQIGDDASAYSYPLDNLGCFIKYNQDMPAFFQPIPLISTLPYNSCTNYRNAFSGSLASRALWQGIVGANGGLTVDQNGFFHALAGMCNCVYDDAIGVNLNIANQITAALTQISQLISQMNNAINNYISGLPHWIQSIWHAVQWVVNAVNSIIGYFTQLINGLNALLQTLYNQLSVAVKLNTTEYRLIENTYMNPTPYTDCINTMHLGSDAYFGIYLRDVLHANNSGLPGWLQVAYPTPTVPRPLVDLNMKAILDGAPCAGNFYMYPNIPSSSAWGASNRIDRQDPLWKTSCIHTNQGEYAGTDYMLLHNLYYLSKGTSVPLSDYSDRKVTIPLPQGNIFTPSNKRTIGAFEYLTASNTVNSNAAVDYRAGKEIIFSQGFSAAQGSDLSAYISPFNGTCNNDDMSRKTGPNQSEDLYDGVTDNSEGPKKKPTRQKDNENSDDVAKQEEFLQQLKKYSEIHDINTESNSESLFGNIELFPNPNNGQFTVNFNFHEPKEITTVVTDVLGKPIYQEVNSYSYYNLQIDLRSYSKGLYIVKFTDNKGNENTKKVSVQ